MYLLLLRRDDADYVRILRRFLRHALYVNVSYTSTQYVETYDTFTSCKRVVGFLHGNPRWRQPPEGISISQISQSPWGSDGSTMAIRCNFGGIEVPFSTKQSQSTINLSINHMMMQRTHQYQRLYRRYRLETVDIVNDCWWAVLFWIIFSSLIVPKVSFYVLSFIAQLWWRFWWICGLIDIWCHRKRAMTMQPGTLSKCCSDAIFNSSKCLFRT